MPPYVAPYQLSDVVLPQLPEGEFTVPVCTTPERYRAITDALWGAYLMNDDPSSYEHLVDWLQAIPKIVAGCVPIEAVCRKFPLTDPRVSWYPESPYNWGQNPPSGYPAHPFTVVPAGGLENMIAQYGLGYAVGDVFVYLGALPVFSSWNEISTHYGNMPHINIAPLNGIGTVKLHVLSMPFGGRLLVVKDNVLDLVNLQSIEVSRDTSFPPESVIETIVEVPFETSGEHTLTLVWYPVVTGDFVPFGFGGGIRSFELCGFGVAEGDCDCMAENCCSETNALLSANNLIMLRIANMLASGFKIVPIDLDGKDFLPLGCAPTNFDSDPDDTGDNIQKRADVLCFVIQNYVFMCLMSAAQSAGIPIAPFVGNFAGIPEALQKIKAEAVNIQVLLAAIGDFLGDNLFSNLVVCEMLASLQGKLNSFDNFRTSVEKVVGAEAIFVTINNIVVRANQDKDNYILFSTALEQAMGMDISSFTCPCDGGSNPIATDCSDIQLVDWQGRGTQFEYLGACIWKLTQPTVNQFGRRYMSFKDANGKQLKLSFADGYDQVNMSGCTVTYDCGKPDYNGDNYGGGCVPDNNVLTVDFWKGDPSAVSVWIKVEEDTCP